MRDTRGRSVGFVGSMAALLAHGLVDNALFFPDLALAFFLVLALVQSDRILERQDNAFETF